MGQHNSFKQLTEMIAWRPSSFLTIGILGYLLGISSALLLAWLNRMEMFPVLLMSVTVAVSFFVLAFAGKIITGREDHILYRYFIFCGVVTSLVLWSLNFSVLFYLDIYAIGFGFFHCLGRIGCHRAGCCHGMPSSIGLVYHQNANSPYSGVKLLPVQLIESFLLLIITTICSTLMLRNTYVHGEIISWYVVLYGMVRFSLEFFRGDTDRKIIAWFSEAQWTAIGTVTIFVFAERIFSLGFHESLSAISVIFLCCVIPVGLLQSRPISKIFSAKHSYEVAKAVQDSKGDKPYVFTTSAGVRIGLSFADNEGRHNWYCSLSYSGTQNKELVISKTFRIIRLLKFANREFEFVRGNQGVYHYIISSQKHERKQI